MLTLTEKAEAGNKIMNHKREMTLEQCRELLDEVKRYGLDGAFDVICKVYNAGFYQGYEQHKAEVRRANKCRRS